ncbi:hypothetical protein V5799_026546 [Amblyomma americanum]|uniref:Uncharacterized protein n=1 Tax=Amblyomma americanum TaxID=6943 RepID=A0AAQ4DIA0_AMBAM
MSSTSTSVASYPRVHITAPSSWALMTPSQFWSKSSNARRSLAASSSSRDSATSMGESRDTDESLQTDEEQSESAALQLERRASYLTGRDGVALDWEAAPESSA